MRHFRCKYCKTKTPIDSELITSWIHRFDTKSCRVKFNAEKRQKEISKVKVRKAKKKEKKANSVSVLKKKLWKIVSEYIRRRDSNSEWIWKCCTCTNEKPRKELQAWHYIPSGSSSKHRYNEFNIHIQCYWCNCGKWWNLIEYRPFMIDKYWLEFTESLFETRNELINLWTVEIKEFIEEYTIKLNNL